MTPTDLNLFFVQEMLQPEDARGWDRLRQRCINATFRKNHPGKNAAASKLWRQNHPDRQKNSSLAWECKNPGVKLQTTQEWRKHNPEKMRIGHRRYITRRRLEDPIFKLTENLRNRINQALKGDSKASSTCQLLGMEIKEFKIYIQGQFSDGMTWANQGMVWHIDHIRPCSKFDLSDPIQQRECFNWSNCQPLFAEDNLRKGNRV